MPDSKIRLILLSAGVMLADFSFSDRITFFYEPVTSDALDNKTGTIGIFCVEHNVISH